MAEEVKNIKTGEVLELIRKGHSGYWVRKPDGTEEFWRFEYAEIHETESEGIEGEGEGDYMELQFKTPIRSERELIDRLSGRGYDIGTDAHYEDPDNYVTVIVRIPEEQARDGPDVVIVADSVGAKLTEGEPIDKSEYEFKTIFNLIKSKGGDNVLVRGVILDVKGPYQFLVDDGTASSSVAYPLGRMDKEQIAQRVNIYGMARHDPDTGGVFLIAEEVEVLPPVSASGKIVWKYNRYGHVEVWKGTEMEGESDLYLQIDTDVEAFFDHLGLKVEEVNIDDWDAADDPGYFHN